jgi:hypothetical protein
MQFLNIKLEQLKRMIYWAWALRNSHDWDHTELLKMEVLKLKRMLQVFESPNSYHSPECENYKPKMKSLRLAVKIGELLLKGDFYSKNFNVDHTCTPANEKGFLGFTAVHKDTRIPLTEEELSAYYNRLRLISTRETQLSQTFYKIITKYHQYWWD